MSSILRTRQEREAPLLSSHQSSLRQVPHAPPRPGPGTPLLEIETNTRQRLGEAQRTQWLGEVASPQESLRHIADKKQRADQSVSPKTRWPTVRPAVP